MYGIPAYPNENPVYTISIESSGIHLAIGKLFVSDSF